MQEIPLGIEVNRSEESDLSKEDLEMLPVAVETPVDSKPLKPVLVIFKIEPAEMAQHVPVRTTMPAFGEDKNIHPVHISAYPAPSDITTDKSPLALHNGYFLDRSGFVNASTRFLDLHFDAYLKIPQDSITQEWLNAHLIPSDAMHFEWMVCNCDTEDAARNVSLLNSMIDKGIANFKHPEISTEIHPRYGSIIPKK